MYGSMKKMKKYARGSEVRKPQLADLNKDGKLSPYEKKRGMKIEKAMSSRRT
jgi:hypothetical protein